MFDSGEFESRIRAFEQAWHGGTAPAITDFLPQDAFQSQQANIELLVEFVSVDLEFRWREAAKRHDVLYLEDYIVRFPELGSLNDLPLELITEEYRARQLWGEGDAASHDSFLERFPGRRREIKAALVHVDEEIRNESDDLTQHLPADSAASQPISTKPDPEAPLAYQDFLLQKLVGAGQMGKVYRAWQRSLDRPVAVKYLRKSFLQHDSVIRRFIQEARTVARLNHPAIVGIHGLGRTPGGGYFIAMELIDGRNLADVIRQSSPVPITDAVAWTCQTCEAIGHAHERGIIHCDLKPANLLLDQDDLIHVTDFGLARMVVEDTRTDACMEGTAPFMAPEQVTRHWGPVSPVTDVYGIGAVLYTLLIGRPPFEGRTLADILAQTISATPIVPPHKIRSDIPRALCEVCLKSLARTPNDRFGSVQELREILLPLDP